MRAFGNIENDHMFVVIKKEDCVEVNETYDWKNYNPDDTENGKGGDWIGRCDYRR